MKIHGLQKMTLLDFPGNVACTVFLGGCDFRCPYCHNYDLVDGTAKAALDDTELFAFLKKRKKLLDGVAVTGGEPCMRADLPAFLREIKQLGFLTKLDTNGYHPAMLRQLLEENLVDYVAMDIKNSPAKYAWTVALPDLNMDTIRESISLIKDCGINYEFRTTVVREFHGGADFHEIGELIRGAKQYFLQCFTDRDTVPYGNLHAPSFRELRTYQKIMMQYVPATELRGVDEPA